MRAEPSSSVVQWGRAVAFAVTALAAGCAQMHVTPPPQEKPVAPAPAGPRYEPVIAQDAATVAELRAAQAPKEPEVANGTTPSGDEPLLNGRGYARIGDGYVPSGDARAWALQQGQRVGADKVFVYAPDADGTTHAAFYVRYRLPFGATFRTVTTDEQKELGSGGVQLGEIVGGTPASEANLRRGDFVIKFNGKPIAGRTAFQQMLRENMGKRVTLTVSRNGVTMDRLVRLGVTAQPQAEPKK
jgi:membrane-associated protease RseP (regulator of RpoE activity)